MKRSLKIAAVVGVSAITAVLSCLRVIEDLDLAAGDQLRKLVGRTPNPPNVVVVAMDETSYQELGVSFDKLWPRTLHAKLLRRLKDLGVARVAFDVLFTGASSDPEADRELADAMALNETVIGVEANRRVQGSGRSRSLVERLDQPYEEFAKVATRALVNLDMNTRDGRIRAFPFSTSEETAKYPFLAYAAAGAQHHPEWRLPNQRDLIKYYGSARENARIVSYWELFEKMPPREEASFKDAVVFVGLLLRSDTGPAQKDSYFSPYGGEMIFGVEVHAAIAGNLIDQSWIHRPAKWIEVAAQTLAAGLVGYLALSISPVMLTYIVTTIVIGWIIAGFMMMKSGIFLAGAATALLVLPAMVLLSAVSSYLKARRLAEEARQREEAIKAAFSLYVSPDVLPQIQKNELALSLGGESLYLTAMFTDIADFTTLSEAILPEQTARMLNAYFTEVMEVVFANRGTLLKFIGDAIFAVWGAPIMIENHAEMALQTALAIQEGVERFNASNRFPPLITRVGVHTGQMLVGNLGSSKRFDYTAIGDSVNLTSRLEGLNKYLGTTILFSDTTQSEAGEVPGSLPIARVVVKGRSGSVLLYSLFKPVVSADISREWKLALERFRARDFNGALELFDRIKTKELRLQTAALLYLGQIAELAGSSLSPDWDGEIEFSVK